MPNEFLERTLEDIIFGNQKRLKSIGFVEFYSNVRRQFRLPGGRIMDIFTWEIKDNILYYKIIELKKGCLSIGDVLQICEYFEDVSLYSVNLFADVKGELVLVGTEISLNVRLLGAIGTPISFYQYSFGFEGLRFEYIDDRLYPFHDFGETGPSEFLSSRVRSFSEMLNKQVR